MVNITSRSIFKFIYIFSYDQRFKNSTLKLEWRFFLSIFIIIILYEKLKNINQKKKKIMKKFFSLLTSIRLPVVLLWSRAHCDGVLRQAYSRARASHLCISLCLNSRRACREETNHRPCSAELSFLRPLFWLNEIVTVEDIPSFVVKI